MAINDTDRCSHTRLSGYDPGPLIVAVLFLLGFYPDNSLVVVLLDESDRIVLTIRMDWKPESDPQHIAAVVRQRSAAVAPTSVMLIATMPTDSSRLATDEVNDWLVALAAELTGHKSLPVRWLGCANREVWSGTSCSATGCPPHQLPDIADSDPAMQLIAAGAAPVGSRQEVLAEIAANPCTGQLPAVPRPENLELWRDHAVYRILNLLESESLPEDSVLSLFASGISDIRVRDTVLWQLTRHRDTAAWGRLWRFSSAVLRRAPDHRVAAVAAVAGLAAWQLGDGLRAGAAIELALTNDNQHSLANLLRRVLDSGLPPRVWHQVMGELSESDCRRGRDQGGAA